MATMPLRTETFPSAFRSIIDQVDRLYLFLDGHEEIPEPARDDPRVVVIFSCDEPDVGSAGKFLGALREEEPCLYVCVDDDILYPPDFVSLLARELNANGSAAVVGVHGILLHEELRSYNTNRDVIHFGDALPSRRVVDALGTGTLMFNTGVLKFDPRHWPQKNKTDLQFAIEAAKSSLPMVCVERPGKFLRPLQENQADSIYASSLKEGSERTILALELQAILTSHDRLAKGPSAEIFATHGIVDGYDASRYTHRNLIDTDDYRTTLQRRPSFVPLAEALAGNGAALTIDDATVAAARAALLARDLGHAVTLFINPWQIEDGQPSWFSCLNIWLDSVELKAFRWNKRDYDLSIHADKVAFRTEVKGAMRTHNSQEQTTELIDQIEILLDVHGYEVPDHLRCLTVDDLAILQAKGVDIQNHSWTHLDPAALGSVRFAEEYWLAKNWLRETLGIDSQFFASAYGEYLPHPDFLRDTETVCLLLHNQIRPGRLTDNLVNRHVLYT